ncbi:hypothetical protein G3N95_24235 [Paraburkholderia sp. Tr-20389]|uniref:hypothetical protein n=1 Tax=Paraburkholderia sp. Tr-20389 TaxID=2703903 RepID=UPI00197E8D0C|nr:hypothetical protein [Paraburkholderia sp. Tr-20389]MBN3756071.1 hypothetical protein [Paraburkholderia sp. Tr-20389]
MASAGSLIFELAADVAHLRQDMAKANDTITSSLKGISNSVAGIAALQGAQFAMSFAKGFADKVKEAIDEMDALGKLAQRIGTTTAEISALAYAGQFAGVGLDDLTTAFKGLNKSLLESRDPLSDSAAAFKALGLNAEELRKMDPGKAFEEIAAVFPQFADGAEKAAVATQLFGKQGQALIPLLNGGKDGIEAMRKEAEDMGLIVSTSTAKAMGDLNDDLTRISNLGKGAAAVMATEMQPAIAEVVKILKDAATEGTVWNGVLEAIVGTAKVAMQVIVGLTGTLSAFAKLASAVGTALNQPASLEGMKNAANIVSDAWNQARDDLTKVHDAQVRIGKSASESEKATKAEADAVKSIDSRPVLQFTANLDANAKAAKKAKKEVDEYANMLQSLQEQYRSAQANGDEMLMLLTDPKFAKFTAEQQRNLTDIRQATLDLTAANEAAKKAEEDLQKVRDDADKAEIARVEGLRTLADTTLDALDPTREYVRTMTDLVAAQQAGFLSTEQLAAAQEVQAKKLQEAMDKTDPMKDQIKSLQQAIEGFGKNSSDALVDFMFSTKDASVSFGEMVTAMLKDLAKLLVYKNVFEPLVGSINSSGWTSVLAGVFSGNRMAGGPVQPGSMYRVNETPLRGEYFVPNAPGRITTGDASGGGTSIVINVNADSGAVTADGDGAKAIELAKRIALIVKQVIANEKRTGGLLAS